MTVPELKRAMLAYAKKHEIPVPSGFDVKSSVWGDGAKKLAWRITEHLGWKQSTAKSVALQKAMLPFLPAPPQPSGFTILHDYHAYHHSENRFGNVIKWFVVHDMEAALYKTAAEAVGRYFETKASGGSTNYGIDDDSIQQYLSDKTIPWGAPGANTNGLHVELMGMAGWSREKWLEHKGTLNRCAWLMAKKCKEYDIPLRFVLAADLRKGVRGVTDHHECTKAFGGSHTDPGERFPMDFVLEKAKKL